ncbi:mucin-7-like [Papaver somniferum]|uniref:mucin-7-like n=1 Tax=Papaver somniferum TaxID=3469 RepID=UPI000E6F71E4|nr:mucin-7-like [Papaver somniferum]
MAREQLKLTDITEAYSSMHLQQPDDAFYMDTGATSHLTADPGNIHNVFNSSNVRSILVGNGNSIPVTASGTKLITLPSRTLQLKNTLVVPDIIKNLVSPTPPDIYIPPHRRNILSTPPIQTSFFPPATSVPTKSTGPITISSSPNTSVPTPTPQCQFPLPSPYPTESAAPLTSFSSSFDTASDPTPTISAPSNHCVQPTDVNPSSPPTTSSPTSTTVPTPSCIPPITTVPPSP